MASSKKPNLDSVTTINNDGSRYFLHPSDVKGKWMISRRVVGMFLSDIVATGDQAMPGVVDWDEPSGHMIVRHTQAAHERIGMALAVGR